MIINIFYLLIIAFITYLIELPIICLTFYKKISFKKLSIISLFINLFTNIILNFVVLQIYINTLIVIISEIVIVFVEYFGYKFALKNDIYYNKYKIKIFFGVLLANMISFSIGEIIL